MIKIGRYIIDETNEHNASKVVEFVKFSLHENVAV